MGPLLIRGWEKNIPPGAEGITVAPQWAEPDKPAGRSLSASPPVSLFFVDTHAQTSTGALDFLPQ